MANFIPQGKIQIGRVPFDNSYRHTMTFANAEAQRSYFASVCSSALSDDDYTYVRRNSAIRVPYNAEELYTYNYVMYQNANYGTKWFYAFIVDIQYVNKNTTELVLELDVMQTWYFDYQLKECFVEREHVSDDTIGAHTLAEPSMPLEYDVHKYKECVEAPRWIVVQTTEVPSYPNADYAGATGCDDVSGSLYQGVASGALLVFFDRGSQSGLDDFKKFMSGLNQGGGAEGVVDVFMVSDKYVTEAMLTPYTLPHPPSPGYGVIYTLKPDYGGRNNVGHIETSITRDFNLDGYTPHNNKLFTYPYQYVSLGDFNGHESDYKFELMTNPAAAEMKFFSYGTCSSNAQAYVVPLDYNASFTNSFSTNIAIKCGWLYDTYMNWASQNQMANTLAIVGSVVSMGASVVPGLSNATGILGRGSQAAAAWQAAGNLQAAGMQRTLSAQDAGNALSTTGNGLVGGALGLAGTIANYDRMERQPNRAMGNTDGNIKAAIGTNGFYMTVVGLRNEYAKIVDGFFDMYGYQVDTVKVPNVTGRKAWNYVKCQNSCNRGNVPAPDMAKINSIFDNGITFWHTADVGNYSLDNTL